MVVSEQNYESGTPTQQPPVYIVFIRYYGISCRVVMAASTRPAAIHGQICTATQHNKRRAARSTITLHAGAAVPRHLTGRIDP